MNKNPSAAFGYYGGVASNDVYFPPETYKLVYEPKSVPFTQEHQTLLALLTSSSNFKNFLKQNAGSVMVRILSSEQNNQKTFQINSLNDIGESITYTTDLSSITIAVLPTQTPSPSPSKTVDIFPPTPEATETPLPTPTSTSLPILPPTPEATSTPLATIATQSPTLTQTTPVFTPTPSLTQTITPTPTITETTLPSTPTPTPTITSTLPMVYTIFISYE